MTEEIIKCVKGEPCLYCGSTYCRFVDEINELKQENRELKKDVQLFKCLDTFGDSECHCACRCLGNEFCEDADKKINIYRSALEEIREIAENAKEYRYATKSEDYTEGVQTIGCYVLDKINEILK